MLVKKVHCMSNLKVESYKKLHAHMYTVPKIKYSMTVSGYVEINSHLDYSYTLFKTKAVDMFYKILTRFALYYTRKYF
jgi:hypothetical protein